MAQEPLENLDFSKSDDDLIEKITALYTEANELTETASKETKRKKKEEEPPKPYVYDEFVGKTETFEEIIEAVKFGSTQVQEMIDSLVANVMAPLDDYIEIVRNLFLDERELTNQEVDHIIVRIACLMYPLLTIQQTMDVHKSIATEEATYHENANLLSSSGTVAVKQANAINASIRHRVVALAYKSASALIQSKISGAKEILSAAKAVQKRRLEEMKLTGMATSID